METNKGLEALLINDTGHLANKPFGHPEVF